MTYRAVPYDPRFPDEFGAARKENGEWAPNPLATMNDVKRPRVADIEQREAKAGRITGRRSLLDARPADLVQLARARTRLAIHQLTRLAEHARNEMVRVRACEVLLERGYGRAPQAVKISTDSLPEGITVRFVTAAAGALAADNVIGGDELALPAPNDNEGQGKENDDDEAETDTERTAAGEGT